MELCPVGWVLKCLAANVDARQMALRDVQVRYKQTALGALWAIITPLVSIVVFTVFFGHFLGVADRGIREGILRTLAMQGVDIDARDELLVSDERLHRDLRWNTGELRQ